MLAALVLNVTVKQCSNFNSCILIPTENDGELHNCVAVVEHLMNPDFLFVDGSAMRDAAGNNKVGFAVTTESSVVCSALPL